MRVSPGLVAVVTSLSLCFAVPACESAAHRSEQAAEPPEFRPADAVSAVAGQHYRRLDVLRGALAERTFLLGPGPSVAAQTTREQHTFLPVDLVAIPSRRRRTYDVSPGLYAEVLDISPSTIVVSARMPRRPAFRLLLIDRSDGSRRLVTLGEPELPDRHRVLEMLGLGPDGRAYFTTGIAVREGVKDRTVWSAALAAPGRLREELTAKHPAFGGGTLVWVTSDESTTLIHWRRLTDGSSGEFALPEGCSLSSSHLRVYGEVVAPVLYCPDGRDYHVRLYRLDGTPIAHIYLGDRIPTDLGSRYVTFPDFVFDLKKQELLRLTDNRFEFSGWPQVSGTLVAFPRMELDRSGSPANERIVIARMTR